MLATSSIGVDALLKLVTTSLSTIGLVMQGTFAHFWKKDTSPCVCLLHKFVHSSRKEKKQLGMVLDLEKVVALKYLVYMRHGFLHYAGAVWKVDHEMGYYM